jgi:fermentation-respiration switch protein FrsA (DUF1100 family)
MPKSVAQRLYDAIPSPHTELVFFAGAGHGNAYESAPDRYVRHILDFIGETESN